jgi:hypothetical protein
VYLDDLIYLTDKINKRKASNYLIDLIIADYPWQDKSKKNNIRQMFESKTKNYSKDEKLDKSSFERFKQNISTISKSVSVK